MNVRTRMAPSPTGEYHIGHIRTVLYNYALARKNGGKFIIRIEDTDRERFVEGATDRILNVINDYGLGWDEGPRVGGNYGPYVQSERLDSYKKYAMELLEKGKAYYCFCSSDRLDKLREEQRAQGLPTTKYDKHCLHLSAEEIAKNLAEHKPYVIRLKVPENVNITFHDEIIGDVTVNTNDIDDQVLIKSDGFPTYHMGVVVDDHLMEITHIMRGTDWIPSTPKHVLLYEAFGWEAPKFVHLPNLKELGGSKKLSKRFGSVAAIEFLQEGYLPRALNNFLMFLGWNPGTEKEIYSMEEFINDFSLDRLQKTDLVSFDRDKLRWYNGYYIRNTDSSALWSEIKTWAGKFNIELVTAAALDSFNISILDLIKDRMHRLLDFNDLAKYFVLAPVFTVDTVVQYTSNLDRTKQIVKSFIDLYATVESSDWTTDNLDKISHEMIAKEGYKPKEAFMTLRVMLTGETATPPVFAIAHLLGKETVLNRLNNSILN